MASLEGMTDRHDGRAPDQTREVRITRNWLDHAEGSVLVEFGRTRVLCAASFTEGVPRWLKGKGTGWVTAEYAMLPRATNTRSDRESVKGRIGGRTHEISRLIGRSLRAVIDTKALGENTIVLDCDVLQADGGTRTAAITGAYVALADAIEHARSQGLIGKKAQPLTGSVAAVSVGIVGGRAVLDLDYPEDSTAETDMNVVMTGDGRFIEVQGTAEGEPFDRDLLGQLLDLATKGCADLTDRQQAALSASVRRRRRPRTAGWSRDEGRPRHPQHAQGRGAARDPRRRQRRPRARDRRPRRLPRRAGRRRGRRDLRAERDPQGRVRRPRHGAARPRRRLGSGRRRARRRARHLQRPVVRAAAATAANLELLLAQLGDVRDEHRAAAFVCAAALVLPDGRSAAELGRFPGTVAREAAGHGRLRLRPDLRAIRPAGRQRTHTGGVRRRREEPRLAPGARLPRTRATPEGAPEAMTTTSPATRPGTAPQQPVRPLWWGALDGVVAGLLTVGLATLAASLLTAVGQSSGQPAPIAAVGGAFIDRTPPWLKDFAVATFGTNDKRALLVGTVVVLALACAAIGVLASRRLVAGLVVFAVVGVVGAAAVLSRPGAGPADVLPTIVGTAAGLWFLSRAAAPSTSASGAANPGRRWLIGGAVGAVAAYAGSLRRRAAPRRPRCRATP